MGSPIRPFIIERISNPNGFRLKTFSEAWLAGPAEFIVKNMDRSITTRAYVVAWLLCAVLTGLAIHSPHCDQCDRPYVLTTSLPQPPRADHQLPTAPDTCNGICWCCGFHGLPNASPVLSVANHVSIDVWPEPVSLVLGPRSPIFRPPRIAISS
jgi:hypothetical protein